MNRTHDPQKWTAKKYILAGFLTLAVLVIGIGSWAIFARLAGAIVASGLIEVESNRQVVQHPEGGIVSEILIDDGDLVNAGDVLLRLDDTLLRSELAIVEGQLFEYVARSARLTAERDGTTNIVFSDELNAIVAQNPKARDLLDGQTRLFIARKTTLNEETSSLREQAKQVNERTVGLDAQLLAVRRQRELIQTELATQIALLSKGLTQSSQVGALQREEARLDGQIGRLKADIAQARGQITVIEIEIMRLKSARREESITTLRNLRYNEAELQERRLALLARLSRFDIRAPRSGIIYGLQVHALRSVLAKAATILSIVPQDASLVITARIAASDIDQVKIGQAGTLRFSAFDMRTTPEIRGTVTKISADIVTDDATGASFFVIEMIPNIGEIAILEGKTLLPGMPVEVFIRTGELSPWQYITSPLSGYFNRAFREN
ncbi:MAG: RTX toxin [Rhodobacteraceae bacterium]|nr:MAG: RTX toxin [Paracoccaceae bacterium]